MDPAGREFLLPIGGLSFEHLALQPPALPLGKIGVLNGQGGQRRGTADTESGIERGQFPNKYSRRPAVGNNMVD